ncbi:conserved hypothetical protein [Echinococcus multilocularis]|uniref:Uncharacterized protein n=1 Tax=Echinococcus multilocularis TaxID=6211 RepID=A0A087VYP9_ECHMU|nr:conserved hypothetical protein [Echinococcus multilocularis]
MGNCGLHRKRKKDKKVEEHGDEQLGRVSQNSYGKSNAREKPPSSFRDIVKVRKPLPPWGFNSLSMPISIRHATKAANDSNNFLSMFKKYIPTTALKKGVIRLQQRYPKAIPYVYATALGFARLEQAWKKCQFTRRPGIKSPRGSVGAPFCDIKRLDDRDVPPEKEKWWRYTMFLLVDPLEKDKFPRRLAENGGQLVSVESRTGCEIRIGERKFLYRGNLVRHFFIDGPTQNAIVCCQNSLPQWLLKNVIIDHKNSYRKEPLQPGPVLMKLERFTDFEISRQTALVN